MKELYFINQKNSDNIFGQSPNISSNFKLRQKNKFIFTIKYFEDQNRLLQNTILKYYLYDTLFNENNMKEDIELKFMLYESKLVEI